MNKFDTVIWRINGLLILGVGAAACLTLLFSFYSMYQGKKGDRNVGEIITVNEETQKKEYLFLGSFQEVDGQGFFICPLVASQEYNRLYYSKSASSIRNYLFFNPSDASSRWLLESNNWLVSDKHPVYKNFNDDKHNTINRYVYEIVKKDTNGDERLSHDDIKTIYFSKYDGTNLIVVIKETDDVLGIHQIDEQQTIIFHRKNGNTHAFVIDNYSGNVVKKTALPI
jgi:hypothetical protein